jgi:hypothetical protein
VTDRGWGTARELLVVLRPDADSALAELAAWGEVTSRLPPRLALVVLPAERATEAERLAGVAGVFAAELPPALRETLAPPEQLFVDGWLARAEPKPPRPGDGRRWDAEPEGDDPPRLPPDPPAA